MSHVPGVHRCLHGGWLGALVGLLATAATAQNGQAFREAYERYAAADDGSRAALAAAASDCFLAIAAADERSRCLVDGLDATLAAGRVGLVLAVAAEARAAGRFDGRLVDCHLTALLRAGRLSAFVDQVRLDQAAAPAVVAAVLAREERVLLPLAEKALRSGDAERGHFVFRALAAIEPVRSWRLGNLALCLRQLGDIDAARGVYERARALAPDDLELENDYGLFLRAQGDVAGALRAFDRSWQLDCERPAALRHRGPGVTNLVHLEATRPGVVGADPLPAANQALAVRPDATMLKRLVLDVALDRLAGHRRQP